MERAAATQEAFINERVALYRAADPEFADWAAGYGVIKHTPDTQFRVYEMADVLEQRGLVDHKREVYALLSAADRIASAAMWLVVHMTYARNVYTDGRDMTLDDFKRHPEGHTGGSLNMVPAYVGYLTINALTRATRGWLMGQGHCVSAIDATNVVVDNMNPSHAARYDLSDEGLTRFVRDFYSYAVLPNGEPGSPLGSHVNASTAGGIMEGGYLGFAELQYVHMPLPGESLVAFLSDGAFEEQRGGDWAPRWWRADDSGLVAPIMIANGRRIDQRTSTAMRGGADWLRRHLDLNDFEPIELDGRDPASFAWGIFTIEERMEAAANAVKGQQAPYPVRVCYGIAETIKGYGFPGQGTNRAHNLPLEGNPSQRHGAAADFNAGARPLWVPMPELQKARAALNRHAEQGRPKERDNPIANRQVPPPALPKPTWKRPGDQLVSPMEGIDRYFCDVAEANPELRARVGNPDEIKSNRLYGTLDRLKHRVSDPESGIAEAVDGGIITVLNEEAVVSAALANKGGINLVASYEAFAMKMLGAIRQELIFARHLAAAGRPPQWLGIPVIATSHTWENGKNELSHQDTTLCEALMAEMNDVSRVVFPGDWNSAVAALRAVYAGRGQIWNLVIPKRPVPVQFTPDQAQQLTDDGAVRLRGYGGTDESLMLCATGAYQLVEAIKASDRLKQHGVAHSLVYLQEPARLRAARDSCEETFLNRIGRPLALFPDTAPARVFLTHTRPEPYLGTLWPQVRDPARARVLGFVNKGGTLDEFGMLYANRCTWGHAVAACAEVRGLGPEELLSSEELAAVRGEGDPTVLS